MLAALWIAWQGELARAEELVHVGRVRDACTAAAIEGVKVELFTENLYGEPELVASARTDAQGNFALPDGARRGEKIRVRHPRYRSQLDTSSEEEFVLFPRGAPSVFVLRDLEGAPIAGARVFLLQTCRHAVPTVEAVSDAEGRVEIADMPGLHQGGDLSIVADGFGALELDPGTAEKFGTIHLARRRAVKLRLLDEQGQPLGANSCRYEADWSGYALEPDASGRVTIASLFGDREGNVMDTRSLSLALPPAGEEFTLCFGNPEFSASVSALAVNLQGVEEGRSVPLRGLHELGYESGNLLKGWSIPPGRAYVILGAPFSGVREVIVPADLAPHMQQVLRLEVEREPMLSVLLPEGYWLVSVESGGDSITRWHGGKPDPFTTGVPPGAEVVVLAQGSDVRRATLAPWSGEATLDLTTPERVWGAARPPAAPFEASYRVRSSTGSALTVEVSGRTTFDDELVDLDPAPDLVRVAIPAGARFEVRLAAEGHVALWRTGVAVAGGRSLEGVTLPVASD